MQPTETRIRLGDFTLATPPDWALTSVILSGPPDAPQVSRVPNSVEAQFRRNVVATVQPVDPDETAESYFERGIAGLRQAGLRRFESAEPEPVTLEGDVPGILSEQVVVGFNNERVRQMQLICIRDGRAFTLIASHLDGPLFESARDEFRALLLSLS